MAVTTFVFLAGLVAAVTAKQEIAITHPCEEVNPETCTVSQVRIDPCMVNKPCIFKKGENVSMSFDFTPNFSTSNLKTGAYWPSGGADLPFAGLGSDNGCLLTPCPTVSGSQQLFTYNLYVGKKLPTGKFQFKWKIWNGDNDNEACCFKTTIKIKK